MRKLEFSDQNGAMALSLLNLFASDETKLDTRSAIRQSDRIMSKLETVVYFQDASNGQRSMAYIGGPQTVDMDDTDFEKLYDVVKAFKPTNAQARLMESIHKYLENVATA